jgi:hypothetical protein
LFIYRNEHILTLSYIYRIGGIRIQQKKEKTLENPIISKIYALAFEKEQSDYELGTAYYGKTKRRRIMDILNGCDKLFYLKKIETNTVLGRWSIKSKASPLLDIINQNIMDNNSITDKSLDIKHIKELIRINPYIKGISSKQREKLRRILNKKSFRSLITKEGSIHNHFSILAIIGTISSITYASKRIVNARKEDINIPRDGFRTELLVRDLLSKAQKIDSTFRQKKGYEKTVNHIIKISDEFNKLDMKFLIQLTRISAVSYYTHLAIEASYAFSQLLEGYKR